jgi:hypothetical protein
MIDTIPEEILSDVATHRRWDAGRQYRRGEYVFYIDMIYRAHIDNRGEPPSLCDRGGWLLNEAYWEEVIQ